MNNLVITSTSMLLAALWLAPGMFAQVKGEPGRSLDDQRRIDSRIGARTLARTQPSDKPFDPHDLAGIWTRNSSPGGYGGGGTCPDCGDRGFGNDVPPFTPFGQKMFDANKPSYGRTLGSADAAAHPAKPPAPEQKGAEDEPATQPAPEPQK